MDYKDMNWREIQKIQAEDKGLHRLLSKKLREFYSNKSCGQVPGFGFVKYDKEKNELKKDGIASYHDADSCEYDDGRCYPMQSDLTCHRRNDVECMYFPVWYLYPGDIKRIINM